MKYTAFCSLLLSCTVAVIYAQSYTELSDQDLELHQNGDQLERITRRIHHEPRNNPRPPTFPRPSPTFPRPPSGGRYARSPTDEVPLDINEGTVGQTNPELTRSERSPQWGPPKDRRLVQPFPEPRTFPKPPAFPGKLTVPGSFSNNRRFKRSVLSEKDAELQLDGEPVEELTRSERSPQWGPPKDRRLVPQFPESRTFPKPPAFPGKLTVPGSFPNNRRFKRSVLSEQDAELQLDGEPLEELTRSERSPQWGPPKDRKLVPQFPESRTFPKPPSFPGKLTVPGSFPNNRRFKRSALSEQDADWQLDGEENQRFTRGIQSRPWGSSRPRPSPTFPRPPSHPPRYARSPSTVYEIDGPAPKLVRNFGNRRHGRSVLNEQDADWQLDGEQNERFTRGIQSRPWGSSRPRPSPTFPRPPSHPPRYARSPSKVYDINMSAPKVVRNFGDRRHGRSVMNEQDAELQLDGEQNERFTRGIQSGPRGGSRPRPSPTFPRPPSRQTY